MFFTRNSLGVCVWGGPGQQWRSTPAGGDGGIQSQTRLRCRYCNRRCGGGASLEILCDVSLVHSNSLLPATHGGKIHAKRARLWLEFEAWPTQSWPHDSVTRQTDMDSHRQILLYIRRPADQRECKWLIIHQNGQCSKKQVAVLIIKMDWTPAVVHIQSDRNWWEIHGALKLVGDTWGTDCYTNRKHSVKSGAVNNWGAWSSMQILITRERLGERDRKPETPE